MSHHRPFRSLAHAAGLINAVSLPRHINKNKCSLLQTLTSSTCSCASSKRARETAREPKEFATQMLLNSYTTFEDEK